MLLTSISPDKIEFLLKSLMDCFRETGFLQRLPSHPGKKQDKDTKISRPGSPSVMSDEGHPTKVLNASYPLCTHDLHTPQSDTLKAMERLKEFLRVSDEQCTRIAKLSY